MLTALNKTSILCAAGDHVVHVLLYRVLIQRIDLCRLATPPAAEISSATDSTPHPGAAGEEEVGLFVGERPGNGTPDRSSDSVDHCLLVLEQH
jgi:hypothetical protein